MRSKYTQNFLCKNSNVSEKADKLCSFRIDFMNENLVWLICKHMMSGKQNKSINNKNSSENAGRGDRKRGCHPYKIAQFCKSQNHFGVREREKTAFLTKTGPLTYLQDDFSSGVWTTSIEQHCEMSEPSIMPLPKHAFPPTCTSSQR